MSPLRIPGDIGRAVEYPRARGRRALQVLTFFDEPLQPVERLFLAAKGHRDGAIRTILHDHVRAFVDHPDVLFGVDADGVREACGVVVRTPLLHEFQARVELEQHRGGAALDRRGLAGAAEHKQVSARVLGDANGLTDGLIGTFRLSTSSVIFSFGVFFSRSACFACCSGEPASPPPPPRPAAGAAGVAAGAPPS